MSLPVLRVGIAVVVHQGQLLIGIRPPGKPLAGYSEFPGGKCEGDEPSDVCAVRECQEETGLRIETVEHVLQHRFHYGHGKLDLGFWLCRIVPGTGADPQHGFRWISLDELFSLRFPEANAPLLDWLKQPETQERLLAESRFAG